MDIRVLLTLSSSVTSSKAAVHRHETFDFLKDIVDSVKDEGNHGSGAEASAASSSNAAGEPRNKRQKTKAEDEDDG